MTKQTHRRPLVLLVRGPLAAAECPYHRELGRQLRRAGCDTRFLDPDEAALRSAVARLATHRGALGICGSDTLANAALHAAAGHPAIGALIWRGGTVDEANLPPLHCPTLLLASGSNPAELQRALRITRRIGAHLLERVGSPLDHFAGRAELERAAGAGCRWFTHHLIRSAALPAA